MSASPAIVSTGKAKKEDVIQRRPSWRAQNDDAYEGTRQEDVPPEELVNEEDLHSPVMVGFNKCFLMCLCIALGPCIVVTALFSDVGYGQSVYDVFSKFEGQAAGVASLGVGLVVALYLLDFYCPPHIPGRWFTFFEHDVAIPKFVCLLKMSLIFLYGLFDISNNPVITILMTCLMGPIFLFAVHIAFIKEQDCDVHSLVHTMGSGSMNASVRSQIMKSYVGDTKQSRIFWAASMTALILSGVLSGGIWLAHSLSHGRHLWDIVSSEGDSGQYVRWLAPAIAGFSNFGFGLCLAIRVHISDSYEKAIKSIADITVIANDYRAQNGSTEFSADLAEFKYMFDNQQSAMGEKGNGNKTAQALEAEWIKWKIQKTRFLDHISNIIKMALCLIITMFGAVYSMSSLITSSGQFATIFMTCLAMFVGAILVMGWIIFLRLRMAAAEWLEEMPLWRMVESVMSMSIVKAAGICCIGPVLPFVFLTSILNQSIRRRRTLHGRMSSALAPRPLQILRRGRPAPVVPPEDSDLTAVPMPGDQWLTDRVHRFMTYIGDWDWVSILRQAYLLSFAFTCYLVCSRLLNVVLAFLITILSGLPFALIIVATVACGITCFLLPPVPGAPVYLFTGLVIAGTAPDGFETGCVIAIVVSYIMKLLACAIQQVGIGGLLGTSLYIKAQVGVNKPLIRAIEVVLREPGITVGKVAIACGGPDWPTSVLAGLMGISLVNMELVTLPVVAFVAPCTMSGAFYLKKAESEAWDRYASLMLNFTVVSALMQQLVAAWCIQDALESRNAEVTRPLQKNIQLDWIDFCRNESDSCWTVRWRDFGCFLKFIFIFGLTLEVFVAQMFYWGSGSCFGEFAVSDDIDTLVFVGSDGLLKMPALMGLGLSMLGFVCYWIIGKRVGMLRRVAERDTSERLQAYESIWKEARLRLCLQAEKAWPPPRSQGGHIPME